MDVYGMTIAPLQCVQPMREIFLLKSETAQVTGDFGRQPTYSNPIPIQADVQSIASGDLKFTQNIQQQNELRKVFLREEVHTQNRPAMSDGDKVFFDGSVWKIVKMMSQWDVYCPYKIVIVNRQTDEQLTHRCKKLIDEYNRKDEVSENECKRRCEIASQKSADEAWNDSYLLIKSLISDNMESQASAEESWNNVISMIKSIKNRK